ncbi:MAG: hypothetical protein IPL61_18100 [Myxococcales bacterium]|nr:hypothetical protein [Myxococcales bacterium]
MPTTSVLAEVHAPPRPAYRMLALGALAAVALTAFTTHKLVVMARMRGELGDVPVRALIVEGVARRFSDGGAEYQLGDRARPDAAWTIQLTADQAARHPRGAVVEVRCDADECYLPDSVYISDGNVQFDLALLAIELAGAAVCLGVLARRWRAWRAASRGAHLPTVRVLDRQAVVQAAVK